jgi:ribonuclease BN (tRNA processing enzyme)
MIRDGLDFSALTCVLITHTHTDHYAVWDLMTRLPHYASLGDAPPLPVVGNAKCGELLAAELVKKHEPSGGGRLTFLRAKPFEPLPTGGDTPSPRGARNNKIASQPTMKALNTWCERDGKKLLYAHEPAISCRKRWKYLDGWASTSCRRT